MLTQLGGRHSCTDPEPATFGHDLAHAVDALHVHHKVGLDIAAAQANQEVRAAGQDIGAALFLGQKRHRRFDRTWRFISHDVDPSC
jgi:hypothetical protein